MDKQWFNDEMNKIHVPQTDVQKAIKMGIAKAQNEKPATRKAKRLVKPLIASTLLVGFLGSGLVIPQMNHVLAKVPIIGGLFSNLRDPIGENLAASNLVTEINQRAVSNGVGVTINSVYYDGGRISVTFKVDHLKMTDNKGYEVKIADDSYKWNHGTSTDGRVTPEGWIGHLMIDYPDKVLPQHMTLPLTFTSIGEKNGKWRFDIPIHQLPSKKIAIGQFVQSDDQEEKVNMEMITIGKGSAVLDYKGIYPLIGKNDMIRFNKVVDDSGKEITLLDSGMEFSRNEVGNTIESEERTILDKIPENARYLMIYPYILRTETPVTHPLDDKSPFELQSTRTGVKLKVNHIQRNGSQLIVQYNLSNLDTKKLIMSNLTILGESMNLVDSSMIGQENVPNGHMIKGCKFKVLNESKLQYQATFKLDGEYGVPNFSLGDYSLEVPFGFLLSPQALPPIKVNLK